MVEAMKSRKRGAAIYRGNMYSYGSLKDIPVSICIVSPVTEIYRVVYGLGYVMAAGFAVYLIIGIAGSLYLSKRVNTLIRWNVNLQRFLPYDSKDIICDHCQLQHQFVALKLSRRESFNIYVRLDFTVILPISVNGSFRDLINCAYSDSFLLVIRKGICHIPEGLSDINSFPITWMLDILAAFPDGFQPFFFTFLSWIPFYDERHIVVFIAFFHKDAYVFRCIVAGIQPDEQWFFRQLSTQFNGLSQEIRSFFLSVLFPNPQFKIDEVSFRADICHNWGISVKTLVGTGYAFLIGFRIVKGGYINIDRNNPLSRAVGSMCISRSTSPFFICFCR